MLIKKYIFYVFIAVMLGATVGSALAQTPLTPRPIKYLEVRTPTLDHITKKIDLPIIDTREDPCKKEQGFFNKLVVCTEAIINTAVTDTVIGDIHDSMADVASGAIVLYIMFFGLKVMSSGVDKLRTEAFIVFMTATFIIFFNQTTQIVNYKNVFINIQKQFVELADTALTPVKVAAITPELKPNITTSTPPTTTPIISACLAIDETSIPAGQNPLWHRMDCLVPKIFGAHPIAQRMQNCFNDNSKDLIGNVARDKTGLTSGACQGIIGEYSADGKEFYKSIVKQGVMGVETTVFSIFVILVGLMFDNSGQIGFLVVITGLFVPIMLIVAFGQAVYVYLTSFMGITIMALFAPIILPCFLFRRTRDIFDQWLKIIVSVTLKPGILLIYLSFMIYILSSIIDYGGVLNNSKEFRSYSDFVSGASYGNSISKETEVAVIRGQYGAEEYCYDILRDKKVVDIKTIEEVIYSSFAKRFPNVPDNFKSTYKEKLIKTIPEKEIENVISDLFSKYLGTTTTDCSQAIRSTKVPAFTFGDPNGVASTPQDIMIKMMQAANIPYAMAYTPGTSPVPVIELATGKRIDQLKKDIVNNVKMHPNNSSSEGYQDFFIKEYNKYMQTQDENMQNFFVTLLVVLITLAITFTFMNNVIEFGDQLAGLAGSRAMGISNFYGMVTERLNNSIYR